MRTSFANWHRIKYFVINLFVLCHGLCLECLALPPCLSDLYQEKTVLGMSPDMYYSNVDIVVTNSHCQSKM